MGCASCVQDEMNKAGALQVKVEHDISNSTAAVQQAAQKLRRIQQEAADQAEAAWQQQLTEHAAAMKLEQDRIQAEQVTCPCHALHLIHHIPSVPHIFSCKNFMLGRSNCNPICLHAEVQSRVLHSGVNSVHVLDSNVILCMPESAQALCPTPRKAALSFME